MKIRKDRLYVADIMTVTDYVKDEKDAGGGVCFGSEYFNQILEVNGEKELLIQPTERSASRLAFKDFQGLTGELRYLKMLGYFKTLYDLSDNMKKKYIIRRFPNETGDRIFRNEIQLFPGDKTKLSMEELDKLRFSIKYSGQKFEKIEEVKTIKETSESEK